MLLGEVLFQALHLCRKAFHVKVVKQNLQQLDSKKDSFFPLDGHNLLLVHMRSDPMLIAFFSGATCTFGKKCFQNLNL